LRFKNGNILIEVEFALLRKYRRERTVRFSRSKLKKMDWVTFFMVANPFF
jgi:hypothetical protein